MPLSLENICSTLSAEVLKNTASLVSESPPFKWANNCFGSIVITSEDIEMIKRIDSIEIIDPRFHNNGIPRGCAF